MEYLSSDEIAMIFERWLTRRVPRIKEPTKLFCGLCTEPGYGSYLHVCDNMAQPKNIRPICEFKANNPDDHPSKKMLKESIEKNWNFLCEIKKSDYVQELKEAHENS
jgi:hypothetical protein